jgi:hypothetical protein
MIETAELIIQALTIGEEVNFLEKTIPAIPTPIVIPSFKLRCFAGNTIHRVLSYDSVSDIENQDLVFQFSYKDIIASKVELGDLFTYAFPNITTSNLTFKVTTIIPDMEGWCRLRCSIEDLANG